jgi:hypothetical protein
MFLRKARSAESNLVRVSYLMEFRHRTKFDREGQSTTPPTARSR